MKDNTVRIYYIITVSQRTLQFIYRNVQYICTGIIYSTPSGHNHQYARRARRAATARQYVRNFSGQRDCALHPEDRRHRQRCPSLNHATSLFEFFFRTELCSSTQSLHINSLLILSLL